MTTLDTSHETAIAIRMTCRAAGLCAPVVTSAGEAAAPEAGVLTLPAGTPPAEVATALRKWLDGGTACPEAITVGEALYRMNGAPTQSPGARLTGAVVLVTGSAQGFGQGIAESLAAAGARVVVADINDALGEAVAADLVAQYGRDAATYVNLNVSDLDSIDRALGQVLAQYGGVDIFVANAGVLKAGGLDEMDAASFDFVTAVNYKGFFLCAKGVAPIMKLQHRYDPSRFSDIVQISSKSGLEGSKRNFAYAGSKFGGIGLVQSFALELIEDGIKVNAVCPGNYFDGPLWSHPETGLFVQYLNAGKVAGAKTLEDVKAAYLSKVPMGRGCLPDDVARAIMYVREQEYETGQAIPVTGGQVMLN